jgi:hypothetical protein
MNRMQTQFKRGQSGNYAGRPLGSRNKLSERFLKDLERDWRQHGYAVLEQVRLLQPSVYLRVIASIIEKDMQPEQTSQPDKSDYVGTRQRFLEELASLAEKSRYSTEMINDE